MKYKNETISNLGIGLYTSISLIKMMSEKIYLKVKSNRHGTKIAFLIPIDKDNEDNN